ncbi:classical arabinogalactan protein 5-like [Cynara cardunculus var. scolymus]|uniref:Uncharacterized protein n=1 Tax=Cynara cardunculus var. scolymus TaxID=59895 RepID=A0A103YIK5_CYNCS|nr:classical arabinogalactan protein 5-like [Cynara cardunculus var. scolymus]KVI09779.1 hypothetical protein Ccrd_011888 [Cynara cardunculus var. scolymus]
MAIHFRPFLFLVLVLAPLPTLEGSRRTLQAMSPVPSPFYHYRHSAPASSPAPVPQPPPKLTPPPSSGGGSSGGGGGFVLPQNRGGGSSKGLSGGQKAGIVFGVLAGAGLIGFATVVFMKRKSNIRRARFGVLARRSQL